MDNTQLVNMITSGLEQFSYLVHQSHREIVEGNVFQSDGDEYPPTPLADLRITSPEPDPKNTSSLSISPYAVYGDTYYVIHNYNTLEPLTPRRIINPTRIGLDLAQASPVEVLARSPLLFLVRYRPFVEAEAFIFLVDERTPKIEFFTPVSEALKQYVDALPIYFTQVGVSGENPELPFLSILGMNLAKAMRDGLFPIYHAGVLFLGNEESVKQHVENLILHGQTLALLPSLYEATERSSDQHKNKTVSVLKFVLCEKLRYASEMAESISLLGPSSGKFDVTHRVLHFNDLSFLYAVVGINDVNE
ncbi:hypothetical protein IWQ61_001796 [Dispira simplex]|nr:hypothetical protein IWQ61_001796 [Dispira simplex]